jgi:glyoxylase-like metal-dependent hydrolase (beta-lactamase superfamily II)
MIIKCIPGGMFLENCYIVGDEETNEGILVDPGEQIEEILSEVDKSGLKITKIVNTHNHLDHVAGVEIAKQKLGIPYFIHKKDQPVLDLLPEACQRWPQFSYVVKPEVEGYVEEGDKIDIGSLTADILLVPGHSWGHICLVIEDIIIAGDTLFAGSVGRVDLTGGTSMEELLGSIQAKLFTLPDNYNVFPGHGPSTTIGIEKQSNPFFSRSSLSY